MHCRVTHNCLHGNFHHFTEAGAEGLFRDAACPPGKKPVPEDRAKAPAMPPPERAGHRTLKALARAMGDMRASTVRSVPRRHGPGRRRPEGFPAFPGHAAGASRPEPRSRPSPAASRRMDPPRSANGWKAVPTGRSASRRPRRPG